MKLLPLTHDAFSPLELSARTVHSPTRKPIVYRIWVAGWNCRKLRVIGHFAPVICALNKSGWTINWLMHDTD